MIGNFENSRGHLEAYTAIASNVHIRPILGVLTKAIVINVESVFLIRRSRGCLIHLLFFKIVSFVKYVCVSPLEVFEGFWLS